MNSSSRNQPCADAQARSPEKPFSGEQIAYEIVTAKGAIIRTFDERKAAVDWLTKPDERGLVKLDTYPGAEVWEAVYLAPVRRRLWRERPALRLVAS